MPQRGNLKRLYMYEKITINYEKIWVWYFQFKLMTPLFLSTMYMKSPKMGINSCNIVSVHMVISLKQFHFLSAKYWKSFIKRAWSPYKTSTNKSSQVFWDNEFENKKNMLSLSRGFTTGYKVFSIEIDIYQIKISHLFVTNYSPSFGCFLLQPIH